MLLSAKHPLFAESLKQSRKAKNLAQYDLAMRIGVHVRTIYSWEHGDTTPDETNWEKLSVALQPYLYDKQDGAPELESLSHLTLDQLLNEVKARGYDIVLSSKKHS